MTASSPNAVRSPSRRSSRVLGVLRLVVVTMVLGWGYGWAEPRLYPRDVRYGFGWGMAHGACMPMALPALLLGRDVPIYSPEGAGRIYKIGYIAGINLCGLLVFGSAFWQPRRSAANQNHQERSISRTSSSPPAQ